MSRIYGIDVEALARDRGYFVRREPKGYRRWMAARRLDGDWVNIGRTNAEAFAWLEGVRP